MPAAPRHPLLRQVGRRIAEVRRARNLTQERLATLLGVSSKYQQRVERGLENLTLESLARLGDALEVPVSVLLSPASEDAARPGRPPRDLTRTTISTAIAIRVVDAEVTGALPLYSLAAAAGAIGVGVVAEVSAWVVPSSQRRLRRSMFVARVTGKSMEPLIPDGAFCLFDSAGSIQADGRVYLVEHRDGLDPDGAGAYLVKRVLREPRSSGRGGQRSRRAAIRLESTNPAFPAIIVDPSGAPDPPIRLVARLLEVLGGPGPNGKP